MYKHLLLESNRSCVGALWPSFVLLHVRGASRKKPTYYELLGVNKKANHKEIKQAYYEKCKVDRQLFVRII